MTWSLWLISSDLPHRGDVPLSTEGGERKKRAFMLPPAGPVTVITDAILPMQADLVHCNKYRKNGMVLDAFC